jgi:hypothetical protein
VFTWAFVLDFSLREERHMDLKILPSSLSACQIKNIEDINYDSEFIFVGKTDEEISLVCNTEFVPKNYMQCENGWRGLRLQGQLDFSLVGVLSKISKILADYKISIFVVSTFNTDYILVKEENLNLSIQVLSEAGYNIV